MMKNHTMHRVLSLIFAAVLLMQCLIVGTTLPASAGIGDDFDEKYVIFDGGASGKTVKWSAGSHVLWSTTNFNLNIPTDLPEEKIGLYIHITLDAESAKAMNTAGEIELARQTCDKGEIHCSTTAYIWREGENEAIIPLTTIGGYTDGGQERLDLYETINWFRFYTTPSTTKLSKTAEATIWEVAVVDSTAAGVEFGGDDTYLQLTAPLTATPNTIEASIKTNALSTTWTMGTYSGVRYDEKVLSNKTGTIQGVDGIPDGTPYVGGTVKKGGFFGTTDMKFDLSIPKVYDRDDLALTFWLYTSTGKVTKSYIELTSSGKCDVEELCWLTTDAEFADLKVGWNKIVLPLNSRNGAGFDYTRINFSRIWGSQAEGDKATEEFEMYVSEMKIEVYGGGAADASDGFEMVDGLPTWKVLDFSKMPTNWDGGKIATGKVWEDDGSGDAQPADGTVYMEVTPGTTLTFAGDHATHANEKYWKAGFTAGTGNGFIEPNIPKQYALSDLTFTFWIYIPDANLVPDDIGADSPNFEFTSDGDVDGAEIDYLYMWQKIGGLKDGWNYVEIPMDEMDAASDFDLYGINFFRWSYMCLLKDSTGKVDERVRYADFRIVSSVDRQNESAPAASDSSALKPISDDAYMIFSNIGTDDTPIALYLTAQGYVAWTWGDKNYTSDFNTYTGEWIDLALVRDMSAGKFYLYADGEVVYETSAQGTQDIVPKSAHSIAADGQGKGLFEGWLADVRVWSDVRTAQEIRDNRVPKLGHDTNGLSATEPGLLGAWYLIGSTDYVLSFVADTAANGNHAVYAGSRADDWVDYTVPTDVIGENYYTMVFIPDIQELVTGKFTEEWMTAAQWIADNVEKENIVHVIGAGDSTWTDAPAQWEIAKAGFDLFTDRVSWSNMTGNHDYPGSCNPVDDPNYTRRDSTNYQTYFGLDYIDSTAAADTFVDYFDDPYEISTTENAYYRFTVNGINWMILQLEYLPRVHVIEWAAQVLSEYPDDNVILTTHSYITTDNATYTTQWMPYTKEDSEIGGYLGELEGEVWPNGTAKPIWDELIKQNPNIKLLLCGHAGTGDGHVLTKQTKNAAGNTIPQVMINAQDLDVSYFEGQALGMLGLLRFSADGKNVEIQYYSPYHDASYHPSYEEMLHLELAITGESTVAPEYPAKPDEDDPSDSTPEDPTPGEPVTDGEKNDDVLIAIIAVAAVLVAGAVTVVLILLKKKK
ncbi:MAG: hypothetical protein IJW40_05580 [Clostridia bacterium]|nr:hypothetical protein [Clostridia bacterium]